jgi:hypothetical protein
MATRCTPEIGVPFLGRVELSLLYNVLTGPGAQSALSPVDTGDFTPRVRRAGREADDVPRSRLVELYLHASYAFMT